MQESIVCCLSSLVCAIKLKSNNINNKKGRFVPARAKNNERDAHGLCESEPLHGPKKLSNDTVPAAGMSTPRSVRTWYRTGNAFRYLQEI